jgi:ribulose-5-phosphate 4-epimerase/fuculose-1-phosphate aldolase
MGKTVGHFAFKVPTASGVPQQFVTSRRGVDFNELEKVGMVSVMAEGDDKVIAIGGKPSVGGQSQRIIFAEHPDLDCIVHFHCPLRAEPLLTRVQEKFDLGAERIEVRSQEAHECGSHECGKNTSDGLKMALVDGQGTPLMKAVMLDKHGPNIVFNSRVNPATIIDFIERHWDLDRQTSEVFDV